MISHRATESTEVELEKINALTERIIGCGIEVYKQLGPGLLESVYEFALCVELELAGLQYQRQVPISVCYKSRIIGDLRLDLVVENLVVVEIKSVERIEPVFEAQVLTLSKGFGKEGRSSHQLQLPLIKDRHSKIHSRRHHSVFSVPLWPILFLYA